MNKKVLKTGLRQRRCFSVELKRQVVKDIETHKCTATEASREYDVSLQSVYIWLYKYSRYLQKNSVLVVEKKSEHYKSKELEGRIKELEAALGRKQMEIDMLNKLIELANQEYQTDLKKNISNPYLSGSGSTKAPNTSTP